MAKEMWGLKVVAMVLGLLVMAPQTMQLSLNHPLHGIVKRINDDAGPMLAIILTSHRDQKILMKSGHFQLDQANPKLTVAGRKVQIGLFRNYPAVVAIAEGPMANVAATAQVLISTFRIVGVIHYGSAGALGDQLNIGDVVLPHAVAFTGVWEWQEYGRSLGSEEELPTLRFGDYNVPESGENRLGSIQHSTITLYKPSGQNDKNAFWLPIDNHWLRIASSINGIMMEKCTNGMASKCELQPSELVQGKKAASSDIYVKNEAYGEFLHKKLGVTTVDTTSAAIVSVATSNGVPSIVFRGAANKPGIEVEDKEMLNVVGRNVLRAVVAFVDTLQMPMPRSNSY